MAEYDDEKAELSRLKQEKKNLKDEQKKAKAEQKAQKKEAKKKAKELADEEARITEDEGGGFTVVVTTLIIVVVWIAIICALIKLDVGGFGSGVLAPVLKNVPFVNLILPDSTTTSNVEDGEDIDVSGYKSLKEAVKEIQNLQTELQTVEANSASKDEQISALQEEVKRLQTFEDKQVEFERIKNEFYNEVVYADNGPGADEYIKYYESMDPATAEALYKQVVNEEITSKEIELYAQAYSEMKPKQAAAIFESMTDNLELAAKILWQMEPDARGKILGVMNSEVAARLTKIMEPDN
jgi:flagellar motility protein MotE (MotC chaperone)